MRDRIEAIFQDASELQAAAVERLDQGDIGDASEMSWGATKRATDALILARTGEEPERTPETGAALRMPASLDGEVQRACLDRFSGNFELYLAQAGVIDGKEKAKTESAGIPVIITITSGAVGPGKVGVGWNG